MPCHAIGPMPPFSLRLPQTSSLQCQAGLEQTERFSLASHQLPQRRVKQAVAGLAVPSTTILLSHMGIVCTVQDDTGSAGSACHSLTRGRFKKWNNNYCRPDHGMCLAFFSRDTCYRRCPKSDGLPESPQPQLQTCTAHPDTLHNHLRPSESNKEAGVLASAHTRKSMVALSAVLCR